MPTNKLWLEHTEKAAWESVQALREKLAEAEKRMQRLAPPVNGWQALLDALDAAKQELTLEAGTYAELIGELGERSRRDAARLRVVEQELAELKSASLKGTVPPVMPATTPPRFDEDDEDDENIERRGDSESELLCALERRKRALRDEGLSSNVDELLARIEAKVEEMSELEDSSIPEAAVDLGALALLLARASKSGVD
jgi:hypothetical protein